MTEPDATPDARPRGPQAPGEPAPEAQVPGPKGLAPDDQPAAKAPASPHEAVSVALAGNPNAGKTTVFNNLTGARQHVGNYPGVTVEKKEGWARYRGRRLHVVDLPGTYSLTAYSLEERVARDFIIRERPDVIVDVLDASNLERNLYLATQLMELERPMVLALNMSDVADAQGLVLDADLMAELFGVRIVRTVGHRGEGTEALLEAVLAAADAGAPPRPVRYGRELERLLAPVIARVEAEPEMADHLPPRWAAVKLVEGDEAVREEVTEHAADAEVIFAAVADAARHVRDTFGDTPEAVLADRRYGILSGAYHEAVRTSADERHTTSDRIDAIVMNRLFGALLFLALMYGIFKMTFWLGGPLVGAVETAIAWLQGTVADTWPGHGPLESLLVDGVLGGVGGVVAFLPNILLLFLGIALLEDSGYMARAAFIADRLMHKIGLHGKSFIPMLIGFGCTVPAILATRTLETRRDRLTTMLILPLISCSARYPIYMLFIPAFFPKGMQAPVLFGLYLVGIVLAVIAAKVLRSTLFRGESTPFVMELPPYRMPTLKGLAMHTWERGWMFLRKAGTFILLVSVLLWAATTWPAPPAAATAGLPEAEARRVALQHSVAGRVGRGLETVLGTAGFDWRASTAVVGAVGAKELFVAQLSILYALEDEAPEPAAALAGDPTDVGPFRRALRRDYTPLQAVAVMLFCLVSAPCMGTIIATWRESGSWKWAALQLGGLTALAWLLATLVYQGGTLLGIGTG